MGEWGFIGSLFENLQVHSPMLGRFWLFLMLVFRIVILGTVATDLFQDEQQEFTCNTLQPGCKQVCYDTAFPISLYRFWVFHIVLISTPSLLFLVYAMHHHTKGAGGSRLSSQEQGGKFHMRGLYLVNVAFRLVAEVGVLVGQWWLYGWRVEAQFPCSRFPCPYTVDCFTSRPAEKTIFLCFYFIVGVIAALSSFAELCYACLKWFHPRRRRQQASKPPLEPSCVFRNPHNLTQEDKEVETEEKKPRARSMPEIRSSSVKLKGGSAKSSAGRNNGIMGRKSPRYSSSRMQMV